MALDTQTDKPEFLAIKDDQNIPLVSADLGNHSAFLHLRTLSVERKNLINKMTNGHEH